MAKKRSGHGELLDTLTRPSSAMFLSLAVLLSAFVVASAPLPAGVSIGAGGPGPEMSDGFADEEAPEDRGLYYTVYQVKPGDTVSELALSFNVTEDTIISFNDIRSSRSLRIGTYLKVPSSNGLLYIASPGDSVSKVAEKYGIPAERVREFNDIDSDAMNPGQIVFLPDARMPRHLLQEINGDLFLYPVRGWITSWFGYRNDPISGARSFHRGLDLGAPIGTPVRAAMDGYVVSAGYNGSAGNYVILSHHSGYTTTYMHLNAIWVKVGAYVTTSTYIGSVGNTGYSTGPHLHFEVKKHGRVVNPVPLLH